MEFRELLDEARRRSSDTVTKFWLVTDECGARVRFDVRCEDHGEDASYILRKDAFNASRAPARFCPECQKRSKTPRRLVLHPAMGANKGTCEHCHAERAGCTRYGHVDHPELGHVVLCAGCKTDGRYLIEARLGHVLGKRTAQRKPNRHSGYRQTPNAAQRAERQAMERRAREREVVHA